MATAEAPTGAGARWWGVEVSSFQGCSALAGGEDVKASVVNLLFQLFLPIVRAVDGQPGQQQRNHLRGK